MLQEKLDTDKRHREQQQVTRMEQHHDENQSNRMVLVPRTNGAGNACCARVGTAAIHAAPKSTAKSTLRQVLRTFEAVTVTMGFNQFSFLLVQLTTPRKSQHFVT